uniref:Uncharacterized protein n=1 Tax=Chenopodium quinoa TaxID=63459 RepID=A0A803KY19_CHEQI
MMEAGGGVTGGGETLTSSETPATVAARWSFMVSQRFQHYLDKSTPHMLYRWIAFFVIALGYAIRVYFVQGFYIVSYGLGIYILNLLIAFLSPQVDPEIQELTDGPTLPTRGSDEFRPFVRRLPEFKFWLAAKLNCVQYCMVELRLNCKTFRQQALYLAFVVDKRLDLWSMDSERYDRRKSAAEDSAALVRD